MPNQMSSVLDGLSWNQDIRDQTMVVGLCVISV